MPVHPRHSQKRIFDALRCFAALFAHEMALSSYLSASRFSCKHEICSQKGTSELGGTTKIKWNPVYGIPARAASRVSDRFRIAALRIQEVLLPVHPRHSQKRIFDALRCFAALFAHEMALPSYLSGRNKLKSPPISRRAF